MAYRRLGGAEAERLLRWLLRLVGVSMLAALPFLFFPASWFARIHEWIGLGPYPGGAAMDYVVRSLITAYVISGVFLWLVSFDLRHYRHIITFLGEMSIVWGIAMGINDLRLDLPWWWLLGEAGGALGVGTAILYLNARSRRRW